MYEVGFEGDAERHENYKNQEEMVIHGRYECNSNSIIPRMFPGRATVAELPQ